MIGPSTRDSQTKSHFSFTLPDVQQNGDLESRPFRDPAALPLLQSIVDQLREDGFEVTTPKSGMACHAGCQVTFSDVCIAVIMLLKRRAGEVKFHVLTWPSQSLWQRFTGRALTSPDCPEWSAVCSAIHAILARDARLQSLVSRTSSEDETGD